MAKPRFVIHEHHASHLHYDLRLEREGVLKSWAVPKQPPTRVNVKRLAIEVEDHPLDYINFEGVISEGYGKGTVKIWDEGEYIPESWRAGKIVFYLKGQRLYGRYVLVCTKFSGQDKRQWLLFKLGNR
jgi:DNA ligase D-like protein (predicted 3'-phosphoesterase)